MSLATALLAGLLASTAASPGEAMVRVRVLERLHPRAVTLLGPTQHRLEAVVAGLSVDGVLVPQPWEVPAADWRVEVPGQAPRRYAGAFSARAHGGEVALVLVLPLEAYVAQVVASETLPGTPPEALRAQAVVARSFFLAQGPRHAEADVCDLAHCQVLRGAGVTRAHLAAARAAALETEGQVLVLASGAIAETPFHAACGGHTGSPEEVLGSLTTGAEAVEDTGCPAAAWQAALPRARFQAVLAPLVSVGGRPAALRPETLTLFTGQGGYVVRVVTPEGGSARGDAVARALDRALGWGAVRSGRFRFGLEGDSVRVQGTGVGHGLGLCQAGAAARAARGESYQAILQHYFPRASLAAAVLRRRVIASRAEGEAKREP